MINLNVWDIAIDFTGQEAAALIVGERPLGGDPGAWQPVSDRMRRSYDIAKGWHIGEITGHDESASGLLTDAITSIQIDRWLTFGYQGDPSFAHQFHAWLVDGQRSGFDQQRFSRESIQKWLGAIHLKSKYQFVAEETEKPMTIRERTSYLNIIGAMLAQLTAGKANDTTVIKQALEDYGAKQGISERNLQGVFAEAKRSLAAS